jgi:hypothetical protein
LEKRQSNNQEVRDMVGVRIHRGIETSKIEAGCKWETDRSPHLHRDTVAPERRCGGFLTSDL